MNSISFLTARTVFALVLAGAAFPIAAQPSAAPAGILEALPAGLHRKVSARHQPLNAARGMVPFSVFTRWKKWPVGATLRVGFFGGDPALHRRIATMAGEWVKEANLRLDFGEKAAQGVYRIMNAGETAEIRISFDQAGYWSLVGTDSNDPSIVGQSEASMNLAEFDRNPPPSPEFNRVVLHEFGHALGFQHEHQSPAGNCDAEFNWPLVSQYLSQPPNSWSQDQIDFNLRQLAPSQAYDATAPDRSSIMFYHFPAWMFVRGAASPCCVPNNATLSAVDRRGVADAYPSNAHETNRWYESEIARTLQQRPVAADLKSLMTAKLDTLRAAAP